MPQSYYTGRVDFGNQQYACWLYADAAELINAAIKSRELQEKNDNLRLINDSLLLAFDVQTMKFNTSQQALSICQSKQIEYDIIQATYQEEVDLLEGEVKKQKTHKWYAIGAGALLLLFSVTR